MAAGGRRLKRVAATGPGVKRKLVLEMGADHAEFMRLLPSALGGLGFAREDGKIVARDGMRTVRIELSDSGTRTLAGLTLPVTHIVMWLDGYADDELDRFLARFHLAYQRGGG